MNFIINAVILSLAIDIVLGISIIILALSIKKQLNNLLDITDDLDSRISYLLKQVKDLQSQLGSHIINS